MFAQKYLCSFDVYLDSDKLYNMVSGAPTSDDVSENLTNMQEIGESLVINR